MHLQSGTFLNLKGITLEALISKTHAFQLERKKNRKKPLRLVDKKKLPTVGFSITGTDFRGSNFFLSTADLN